MNRRRWLLTLLGLSAQPAWATVSPDSTALAQTAARDWLQKVDHGHYSESWQTAAAMFKVAVTSSSWQQAAQSVRGPLGALRERTEKSAVSTMSLPGTPDGLYVVLQFTSHFEHKLNAAETVTITQDHDGVWRVAGYFIN